MGNFFAKFLPTNFSFLGVFRRLSSTTAENVPDGNFMDIEHGPREDGDIDYFDIRRVEPIRMHVADSTSDVDVDDDAPMGMIEHIDDGYELEDIFRHGPERRIGDLFRERPDEPRIEDIYLDGPVRRLEDLFMVNPEPRLDDILQEDPEPGNEAPRVGPEPRVEELYRAPPRARIQGGVQEPPVEIEDPEDPDDPEIILQPHDDLPNGIWPYYPPHYYYHMRNRGDRE